MKDKSGTANQFNSIQCDATQYDAIGCNLVLCKQFDVHFTLFLTLLARKDPVAINQYITKSTSHFDDYNILHFVMSFLETQTNKKHVCL